ncbi:expressed unknown protein [Seminavis robusta]|uniref:G-protein coupled receptors family 2 profile 2 domain-containing protein n=1 Tax=Seminavis robusta TaxID=568900 RepID=A0A9N8EC83_9STRA|nr:expressed unknown protein [Seminavis robusta]|eukprot:Sro794_g203450.1 n/a (644) ;mRNA; f:40742-42768
MGSAAFEINEILLPQISAVVSMMGSSLIIGEVVQDWKVQGRNLGALSRTLLSMSVGDLLFSFGWFMASFVISHEEDPENRHMEPTSGGCKFQAFIIQMGFLASISFNASLAIIYLLMVQHNWTGQRLIRTFQPVAFGLWTVSFVVALLPLILNLYHDAGPMCWIASDDANVDVSNLVFVLQIIPIWVCALMDSVIMFLVYRKTKQLEQTALRNSFFGLEEEEEEEDLSDMSSRSNQEQQHSQPPGQRNTKTSEPVFEDDSEGQPGPVSRVVQANTAEPVDREDLEAQLGSSSEDCNQRTSSTHLRTSSASQNHFSHIAAVQGLWYIGGFFLTFGPATLSVVVYLVSGSYNVQLYRMSYFFLALQGLWNFLIFSRGRREMKTWIGGKVKQMVWGGLCCRCCIFLPTRSGDTSPASSSQQPSSRWMARSNESTLVHKNKMTTLFSAISNASTVMHSNQRNSSTKTAKTEPLVESSLRWSARGSATSHHGCALLPPQCPQRDLSAHSSEPGMDEDLEHDTSNNASISELSLPSLIMDRNTAPQRPQRIPSDREMSSSSSSSSASASSFTDEISASAGNTTIVSMNASPQTSDRQVSAGPPQRPQRVPSTCELSSCDGSSDLESDSDEEDMSSTTSNTDGENDRVEG